MGLYFFILAASFFSSYFGFWFGQYRSSNQTVSDPQTYTRERMLAFFNIFGLGVVTVTKSAKEKPLTKLVQGSRLPGHI